MENKTHLQIRENPAYKMVEKTYQRYLEERDKLKNNILNHIINLSYRGTGLEYKSCKDSMSPLINYLGVYVGWQLKNLMRKFENGEITEREEIEILNKAHDTYRNARENFASYLRFPRTWARKGKEFAHLRGKPESYLEKFKQRAYLLEKYKEVVCKK